MPPLFNFPTVSFLDFGQLAKCAHPNRLVSRVQFTDWTGVITIARSITLLMQLALLASRLEINP